MQERHHQQRRIGARQEKEVVMATQDTAQIRMDVAQVLGEPAPLREFEEALPEFSGIRAGLLLTPLLATVARDLAQVSGSCRVKDKRTDQEG